MNSGSSSIDAGVVLISRFFLKLGDRLISPGAASTARTLTPDLGAGAFENRLPTVWQPVRKRKVGPPKAKDFTNQRTRHRCNRASHPHFEKAGANVRFLAISSNS